MSKHLPRLAGSILLLSFLTAGLCLAQGDVQLRTTSISNGSPKVLSTSLISATSPNAAPMQDVVWYVIVGSFPRSQYRQANAQASRVNAHGYNMNVHETNAFAGLTPGLLVVMEGPYSRRQAQRVLNSVRSIVRGAYIKRALNTD